MQIAHGELSSGVSEIEGPDDDPRIVEYHATTTLAATDDEVPWCSSFVNWCMKEAGLLRTGSARARSWLRWGTAFTFPAYGAVCILQRGSGLQPGPGVIDAPGHVGFYAGIASAGGMLLLGGNQSNAVTIAAYSNSRVLGYRWPC